MSLFWGSLLDLPWSLASSSHSFSSSLSCSSKELRQKTAAAQARHEPKQREEEVVLPPYRRDSSDVKTVRLTMIPSQWSFSAIKPIMTRHCLYKVFLPLDDWKEGQTWLFFFFPDAVRRESPRDSLYAIIDKKVSTPSSSFQGTMIFNHGIRSGKPLAFGFLLLAKVLLLNSNPSF